MKIEILYPELGNLFADTANMTYFKKCLPHAEFVETHIHDIPTFSTEKVNMIYMGSLTEKSQEIIIEKLMPYKEKLQELIENNTVILFTGNSIEILGNYIENEDGTKIKGIGIFDVYAKRNMLKRKNYTILAEFQNGENILEIVGYKSLFTEMFGANEECYFCEVKTGIGINKDSKLEGLRKNNFFGTYLIGPILIQNPPFTKHILELLGEKEDTKLYIENELMEAYKYRAEEYKKKFM